MVPCHLEQLAREHVRKGRMLVARQQDMIGRLRATGDDCTYAERLLATFQESLAIFEDDLEKITGSRNPGN